MQDDGCKPGVGVGDCCSPNGLAYTRCTGSGGWQKGSGYLSHTLQRNSWPPTKATPIHLGVLWIARNEGLFFLIVSAGGQWQETEGGRDRGAQSTDSRAWEQRAARHSPSPFASLYRDKGMNRVSKAGGCV